MARWWTTSCSTTHPSQAKSGGSISAKLTATWPEVRIVVPITELKEHRVNNLWMVELRPRATNGLTKLSHADTSLVRAVNVDPACFLECLGSLSEPDMERVRRTLALVLDIKADWRPRAGG